MAAMDFSSLRLILANVLTCPATPDQDECGRGAQRGEPQHAGDEQPGDLADVCPGGGDATCRATQYPLLQCARGVDAHQHPTQFCKSPLLLLLPLLPLLPPPLVTVVPLQSVKQGACSQIPLKKTTSVS